MGKHTIYLNDKLEGEMRSISNKEGWSLSDVISKHLDIALSQIQSQQKIIHLENKIKALYELVEVLAVEIGYVAGATRASTKSIEEIAREGIAYETYMQKVSSRLKGDYCKFDNPEPSTNPILARMNEE